MSKKDSLGDRMKRYEKATGTQLVPRMPTIIRVDGKAFHTFTKRINGDNDPTHLTGPSYKMHDVMLTVALGLTANIQTAKLAYTQSDEISILLVDYTDFETQPWFGGKLQKIASVSASMAATYFNHVWYNFEFPDQKVSNFADIAQFDSRVFQLPKEEVNNYFIWRQQDATRNSIQSLGRKYFSHKQMHGKSGSDIQDMLHAQYGINWNDCDTWTKRGCCAIGDEPDNEIPIFTKDSDYINKHVYPEIFIQGELTNK